MADEQDPVTLGDLSSTDPEKRKSAYQRWAEAGDEKALQRLKAKGYGGDPSVGQYVDTHRR